MLLDEILAANSKYNKTEPESVPKVIIITCMDPRLNADLLPSMGLKNGEAFVIRNAGNLATPDVVRSAIIAAVLYDINEIIVLGHTDCAISKLTVSQFLDSLSREKVHRNAIPDQNIREWLGIFVNENENIKKQVEFLRSHPLMPGDVHVHGLMFDVSTGNVSVVVNGYQAPKALPTHGGQPIKLDYKTLFDQRRTGKFEGEGITEMGIDTPDFTHYELKSTTDGNIPVTQNIDLTTMEKVSFITDFDKPDTVSTSLQPPVEKPLPVTGAGVSISRGGGEKKQPPKQDRSFSQMAEVPKEYAAAVDAAHDMLPEKYQIVIDNLGYDAKNVLKQLKRLTGKDYSLYTAVGVPILKNLSKERADKIKSIWESWGARIIVKPEDK
ncbi:MAG: carbonic anhydrase [Chloroflexi bacterium]|nr:carbonic anhydrase [Chloroflexota bacterium]